MSFIWFHGSHPSPCILQHGWVGGHGQHAFEQGPFDPVCRWMFFSPFLIFWYVHGPTQVFFQHGSTHHLSFASPTSLHQVFAYSIPVSSSDHCHHVLCVVLFQHLGQCTCHACISFFHHHALEGIFSLLVPRLAVFPSKDFSVVAHRFFGIRFVQLFHVAAVQQPCVGDPFGTIGMHHTCATCQSCFVRPRFWRDVRRAPQVRRTCTRHLFVAGFHHHDLRTRAQDVLVHHACVRHPSSAVFHAEDVRQTRGHHVGGMVHVTSPSCPGRKTTSIDAHRQRVTRAILEDGP
mmetsp:Transcript_8403/g.52527  ORF Transcript_8403/g.52527 Transcript_8403/m.52527 type:complete len:290 (-) Transcript_8403:1459-2328(-)